MSNFHRGGWPHKALIDLYFGMYCEILVVPSPHVQPSKYIGHFCDISSYFNDDIGRFICCWVQVAEFVNYFGSLTIDSDAGRWGICCKHNCLLHTDLQTKQVTRSTRCITHLLKLRYSVWAQNAVLSANKLTDKICVGFSFSLQVRLKSFPSRCVHKDVISSEVKGRSNGLKLRYILKSVGTVTALFDSALQSKSLRDFTVNMLLWNAQISCRSFGGTNPLQDFVESTSTHSLKHFL